MEFTCKCGKVYQYRKSYRRHVNSCGERANAKPRKDKTIYPTSSVGECSFRGCPGRVEFRILSRFPRRVPRGVIQSGMSRFYCRRHARRICLLEGLTWPDTAGRSA